MRRFIMLAIPSLFLVLAGCSRQATPIELVVGINGTVVNGQGSPVEGAVVVFYSADANVTASTPSTREALQTQTLSNQTVTDYEGSFRYQDAPPGTYNIYVTHDGLVGFDSRVVAEPGTKVQAPDVQLASPGSIAGTVTLSDQANPEGVAVFIPGTGFMAFCDADGHFGILGVPQLKQGTTYRVVAMFSGYVSAAANVTVTKGTVSTVDLELHPQPAPQPAIDSMSPDPVVPGDALTISGTNFGSAQGTSFVTIHNVTAQTYLAWSSDTIEALVPTTVPYGEATVLVAIGSTETSATVTIIPAGGLPEITSVSPDTVRSGGVLIINGSGFGSAPGSVTIGGYPVDQQDYISWTADTIQVRVPYGPPPGTAEVVVQANTYEATASVTIAANHPPSINQFTYTPQPAFRNEPTTFTWAIEDLDGDTVSCNIAFNNGATPTTIPDCNATTEQTHFYSYEGSYTATITADDGYGGTATDHIPVTVAFNYQGTWGFDYYPNGVPQEAFTLDIPQDAAVEGSFDSSVSFTNPDLGTGTLSATVDQTGITATIEVEYTYILLDWSCTLTWNGTRTINSNTVTGPITTDSGFPCGDLEGSMTATKQ